MPPVFIPEGAEPPVVDDKTKIIYYKPNEYAQAFAFQREKFKQAKLTQNDRVDDFNELWGLYEESEIPGLPDISYEIQPNAYDQIQNVLKQFLEMSPRDKFLTPDIYHWLAQMRSIIGQNQDDMLVPYYSHGYEVPNSWIGAWERSGKPNDYMPHEYFRLPTSIAGNPERVTILARTLHLTVPDILRLQGYPLQMNTESNGNYAGPSERCRQLELIHGYIKTYLDNPDNDPALVRDIIGLLESKSLEQCQTTINILKGSPSEQIPRVIDLFKVTA